MGGAGEKNHLDISGSIESPFLIYSASYLYSALTAWGKRHNQPSKPKNTLLQKIEG